MHSIHVYIKAFQPLVEYPGFFYLGFTIGDFAERDSTPRNGPYSDA
jgi:hypothetical protein